MKQGTEARLKKLSRSLFHSALAAALWLRGVFTHRNRIFPYPQFADLVTQSKLGLKVIQ